jgi:sugar lactone lactonase YvrE
LLRRVQLATSTVNTLHLSSTLSGAEGLATFGDSLYVADTNCHRIFKVNISSLVSSAVAGQYPACSPTWNVYSTPTPDGVGTDVRFSGPKGIVVSPDGTYMYVADYGFNRIRNISLFASFTSTKTTVTNITNGTSIIQNITITSSTSLVPNVTVGTLAGGGGTSGLNKPGATDGLGGVALFNGPYGITIDPTGTILYVADLNNHAIRRIVIATTSVSTLAGNVNVPGYLDGVGTNAKLSGPTGIAIDSTGAILYVVDNFNQNLRQVMIDTRVVTTIAGSTLANLGWSDALGTSALFSFPTGVVILPGAVTMMVSDTMNNRIRKVDFVQQCQDGVYCPAGTSAVLASSCPAGTYCPAGSAPLDCPINTYCSASSPSSAGNSIGMC